LAAGERSAGKTLKRTAVPEIIVAGSVEGERNIHLVPSTRNLDALVSIGDGGT
jgi:hypothetical protein